jgi:hypothetical protein
MPRSVLLAAAIMFPTGLPAQGVIVQNVSDVRFYGALGTFVGLAARMGGAKMHDIQSTTSVAGHKLRTESEDVATIIDVDAGRFISIDHKKKTYTSMTFAEMAARMQQAAQSIQQASQQAAQQQKADQAKAAKAAPAAKRDSNNVTFHYSVTADRPGQHEKIAGYDAERIFVTITIDADTAHEGQTPERAGSLVLLLDEYRSTNAPQIAAMQEFQRAYMQKVGEMFRPPVEAVKSAYSFDPRIKEGFSAAAKEMAKVPGVSLRSVTYVAAVPAGMAFDRRLVLADAGAAAADTTKKDDAPKKGRFGGLMGALKSAAEEANKKPADNKSDNSDKQLKQGTLLSVNEEARNITTGAVPPGTFDPPAGYREIPLPPMTPPPPG